MVFTKLEEFNVEEYFCKKLNDSFVASVFEYFNFY